MAILFSDIKLGWKGEHLPLVDKFINKVGYWKRVFHAQFKKNNSLELNHILKAMTTLKKGKEI